MARERGAWAALAGGLLVVLLPKCPLCLAAWAGAVGLTLGATASVAPALRPLGLGMVLASVVLLGWRWARSRLGVRGGTR